MLTPGSYKPYEERQEKVLERGILTQEDIDRIARSPRGRISLGSRKSIAGYTRHHSLADARSWSVSNTQRITR